METISPTNMFQPSDGVQYFNDLLNHVRHIKRASNKFLLDFVPDKKLLWKRYKQFDKPISTKLFFHFSAKNTVDERVIHAAITIYDRFVLTLCATPDLSFKEVKLHQNCAILDMLLSIKLAMDFESKLYPERLPFEAIVRMCRKYRKSFNRKFIGDRQWHIFNLLGQTVHFPSLFDFVYDIYMMIDYKLKGCINLGDVKDILINYVSLYYKKRTKIVSILRLKLQRSVSVEKRTQFWLRANGEISYAAAIIVFGSLVELTNQNIRDIPMSVYVCIEDWLDIELSDIIPELLYIWIQIQ